MKPVGTRVSPQPASPISTTATAAIRPLRSTMNRITRTYTRSRGSYTALNHRKNTAFFAFGSRARNHNAHCVGFNVNALTADINAVTAITNANCRYICPVIPGMNAGGRNTDISTSVIPMIGPNSSRIASIDPCLGVCPRSTCCDTPSTTTIASSTTIPIASTTANNVSRLIENPIAAIPANAPMIVTGTVVAGTSVARQSCRNTTITTSTSNPASNNVWYTSLTDSFTNVVVSNGIAYSNPSGKPGARPARSFRTPCAVASALAPGSWYMAMPPAGFPSIRKTWL